MASIQCSKCKTGIHYHGEPKGIEYIFINEKNWERIISSRFDPMNKQYKKGYSAPMLFQADTIESDFEDAIRKSWRCPECGNIMFFDKQGKVIEEYEEDQDEEIEKSNVCCNHVVFDDYSWDILTDSAVPDWKLPEQFTPTFYADLDDTKLIIINTDRKVIIKYKNYESVC